MWSPSRRAPRTLPVEVRGLQPLRRAELHETVQRRTMVAILKEGRIVAAWSKGRFGDMDRQGFLRWGHVNDREPVEIVTALIAIAESPSRSRCVGRPRRARQRTREISGHAIAEPDGPKQIDVGSRILAAQSDGSLRRIAQDVRQIAGHFLAVALHGEKLVQIDDTLANESDDAVAERNAALVASFR